MNKEIGAAVLDEYFELKKERAKEAKIETSTTVKVNQSKSEKAEEADEIND